MNGMSLVISKPCFPMYNFGTNNKMDLIRPRRLSNLHFQGISPSVAITTTRMSKHRAHLLSALKDGSAQRSQVVEVCGVVVPSYLFGIAIIGMALLEILKSDYRAWHRCMAVYIVTSFLSDFVDGYLPVLFSKPFSVGDKIHGKSMRGQVTNVGLVATSCLGPENVSIVIPNRVIPSQVIVNTSCSPYQRIEFKIFVQIVEKEKIDEISEDIINMMKSNSNVYLKERQPYCILYDSGARSCVELIFGCYLKNMCEDKLRLVKQDILVQSAKIIKKHGATLAQHLGEENSV